MLVLERRQARHRPTMVGDDPLRPALSFADQAAELRFRFANPDHQATHVVIVGSSVRIDKAREFIEVVRIASRLGYHAAGATTRAEPRDFDRRNQRCRAADVRSLSSISQAWSIVWKALWRIRNGRFHDFMRLPAPVL